jgi:hypothetical protein
MYRATVSRTDVATLSASDRLGFRLKGPSSIDLGLIKLQDDLRTFVDFGVPGDDDVSRLILDNPLETFSQSGSFIAIVSNRSTTPIPETSLPVQLFVALLRDATVSLPARNIEPIFLATTFPDMTVAPCTVLVPGASGVPQVNNYNGLWSEIVADIWPTAGRSFTVNVAATLKETTYTDTSIRRRYRCDKISSFRVHINELQGDTLVPVQSFDVAGPEIDVPIHVKDGKVSWTVLAVYDIREENADTGVVIGTTSYTWPLLSFFGTAN